MIVITSRLFLVADIVVIFIVFLLFPACCCDVSSIFVVVHFRIALVAARNLRIVFHLFSALFKICDAKTNSYQWRDA